MEFSFPFIRSNDLRSSLFNITARSFFSLVRRGYIHKVIVQLVPKYFSRNCSTDSISCSKRKNQKKNRLKQDGKTKKGRSKCWCSRQSTWLIIDPLSHRYCSAISTMSLCCCSTVTPPLLLRCRAAVAPLLHRY